MKTFACIAILSIALAACGGSGAPPTATAPPATATQPPPTPTAEPTQPPSPPTPTPQAAASGVLSFSGDSAVLQVTGLPPAPPGSAYAGWLGDATGAQVNAGVIDPAAGGAQPIFRDPGARNLLGVYTSFQITIEDAAQAATLSAPGGPIVLSGSLPLGALDVLRQILMQSDAPGGQALIVELQAQVELMFTHARLSSDALTAGDLRGAKQHAEHVVNIAAGQSNPSFGDHDGNGAAENPGDGFGVSAYARRHAELAQSLGESDVDERTRGVIREVTACAVNVENRALGAIQAALEITGASDASAATLAGIRMVSLANAAEAGSDVNNNGVIENVRDECGAAQLTEVVRRLSDIALRSPDSAAAPAATPPPTTEVAAALTALPAASPAAEPAADMLIIPAGPFVRGDDAGRFADSGPARTITLSAYQIDRFEVTNAAYRACVEAGACRPPVNRGRFDSPAFDQHPVVYVDWNRATEYCAWAGKRLPSEAEWEKAARGDDGRLWPWGEEFDGTKLNSAAAGLRDTTTVGSFREGDSPYGVADLAGNVWEWVADFYSAGYYARSPDADPPGPSSGAERVLRGGGFANDFPRQIVSIAFRDHAPAAFTDVGTGFRCAA